MRPVACLLVIWFAGQGRLAAADLATEVATYHRDFQNEGEGIAAAALADGEIVHAAAGMLRSGGTAIDADTLFEIGSITKVFTGILLADAVLKGKAALDDPVSKHLPSDLLGADSPLRKVTLLDLATHTSGLPRLPADLKQGADPADPYAHYSVERLHACLKDIKETDLVKRGEVSYSNLGVGLLGHLLERIAGRPYEELIRETIFEPAGMNSSFVQRRPGDIPRALSDRYASGHSGGKEVPHWHIDAFCGAGAIVSTTRDLIAFASACLSPETTPNLRAAMDLAAKPQRGGLGLCWFIGSDGLNHDGQTGGFRIRIRVSLEEKTASIRLVNSTGPLANSESLGDFTAIQGFWQGILDVGAAKLRLVLRIAEDGRIVMHSLDQGGTGMPAERAVLGEGTLRAVFSTIGGTFEGKQEGESLVGTWVQNGRFPLSLERQPSIPASLKAALDGVVDGDLTKLDGYWSGYLGGKEGLFVILEIEAFGGTGEARLFSPDQTPEPMPVTKLSFAGGKLKLEAASVGASYSAKLVEDGKLSGSWRQGPQPTPLILSKSLKRPERE